MSEPMPDVAALADLPIVDAHHHFWDFDHLYYPWLQDSPRHEFFLGDQRPLAKTMALGGVEIGIQKAKLVQMAAGIAISIGSIPKLSPSFIIIGRATTHKATLLITSVRNNAIPAIKNTSI